MACRADHGVVRARLGQRQCEATKANNLWVGRAHADVRVGEGVTIPGHVDPVREAASVSLVRGVVTDVRTGLVVGAVTGPAEATHAGSPLLGIIVFGRAFVHQVHRHRHAVDHGPDDAVVGGSVRIVTQSAAQAAGRNGCSEAPVDAIAPGCGLHSRRIVRRGDGYSLVKEKASSQQRGIVRRVGGSHIAVRTAGRIVAGREVEAILYVGVGACSGRPMA